TPPLTQLNTPYPATAYLKGYLKKKDYQVYQADLGIEVVLKLFSEEGLGRLFKEVRNQFKIHALSSNARRMMRMEKDYLITINQVIAFLQNGDSTLANRICYSDFLPQASRFSQLEELDWAFGTMGIQDKARYLSTLFLEDLGDLIQETVAPDFGFSRYAERLGMSATHFDPLEEALSKPSNLIDQILCEVLKEKMELFNPNFVGFTVPFPGNLYGALKSGQFLKANYPSVKVLMGGGYPNTELRDLKEPKVFQYLDYITLDDGEGPFEKILQYEAGIRPSSQLQRTFLLKEGKVKYINSALDPFVPHAEVGTPDYKDLPLQKYLSVIEMANPMHRLWSDGRWNKLTIAHGCYWKKCSFCDISLDYIGRFEGAPAKVLVDRIETIVEQTNQTGFHFVDEAAPPLALRDLAIELIKRGVSITWWANIRFEKTFTPDLCKLLAASGCIAVSGGLEVASDRLLKKMAKGVTIEQVARVTQGFTDAGIMVHAYLMYGFPTQTEQETIDSLEIVRQLFLNGVIHSAFWHLFSMTAHSPVGKNPEGFGVYKVGPKKGSFANNDLIHEDPDGADHQKYTSGLKKALYNYMHGVGLDYRLDFWFDFPVPKVSVPRNLIEKSLSFGNKPDATRKTDKIIWPGNLPELVLKERMKKGKRIKSAFLEFSDRSQEFSFKTNEKLGKWLAQIFPLFQIKGENGFTIENLEESYTQLLEQGSFKKFLESPLWKELRERGLLLIKN
ncbi:B12-binding domain-containing radical SAM protein, partial [Xanthovirga aplysinae]|uniref:B12-binding domain-containing radical SAM protein n=1 Tax=Xanthovirga aplysinae TaxID=2529853 RepID=UPI0012BD5815